MPKKGSLNSTNESSSSRNENKRPKREVKLPKKYSDDQEIWLSLSSVRALKKVEPPSAGSQQHIVDPSSKDGNNQYADDKDSKENVALEAKPRLEL